MPEKAEISKVSTEILAADQILVQFVGGNRQRFSRQVHRSPYLQIQQCFGFQCVPPLKWGAD